MAVPTLASVRATKPFLEEFRNPDGKTYNGVAMLACLSGLSEAEVAWTAARVRRLMIDDGLSRGEALERVKAEAKSRPWETKK